MQVAYSTKLRNLQVVKTADNHHGEEHATTGQDNTTTIMTDTNSRQHEEELPIHRSLVLYFTRCRCTYYHTTSHQIPKDGREPPNEYPCRDTVPEGTGERKPMLMGKAYIEGKCRVHDIEMMQDIILEERRPPDTRPHDDYSAKRDDHLRLTMVGSATARKYRAMNAFNAKWAVQF